VARRKGKRQTMQRPEEKENDRQCSGQKKRKTTDNAEARRKGTLKRKKKNKNELSEYFQNPIEIS
jgi:hypothetical protein